jgi:hypothetical protein
MNKNSATFHDVNPFTLIKKIVLIFKENQMGSVAKSYIRKGFLKYEKMQKYSTIYEEALTQKRFATDPF